MHGDSSRTFEQPEQTTSLPGARIALWLLLGINLFNYIDRQVLSAVLPKLALDATLFRPGDPNLQLKLGWLTTAFLVSYMLLSPVFGWLSESHSRWLLIGIGVTMWSLASGGSGLATTFAMLLLTRCLVGIGEAAYGPVAPSMLSDLYPERDRGKILSRFYLAIPVGSALGFVIGGHVAGTTLGLARRLSDRRAARLAAGRSLLFPEGTAAFGKGKGREARLARIWPSVFAHLERAVVPLQHDRHDRFNVHSGRRGGLRASLYLSARSPLSVHRRRP